MADQVAFLKLDGDEDIGRRRQRKTQPTLAHGRRRPEGDDESQIDRVAADPIEQRRLELGRRNFLLPPVSPHLAQAEQVEMVDQEGAGQHRQPAEPKDPPDDLPAQGVVDQPDDLRNRPPLPIQQDQRQAGEQHIGRALNRLRHEAGPPAFEGRPRHQAVLDGEHAEQQGVDHQRLDQRSGRATVDGLGDAEVTDKGDRIEKAGEEDGVGRRTVEHREQSHRRLSCCSAPACPASTRTARYTEAALSGMISHRPAHAKTPPVVRRAALLSH